MVVALLTRAISCILIQYVRRRTRWQYLEQTVGLISTLKLLEYRVWLFLRGSAVVTDTDKQKYLSCVLSYSFMLNLGGNFFSLHVYLMLCKTACFYFFCFRTLELGYTSTDMLRRLPGAFAGVIDCSLFIGIRLTCLVRASVLLIVMP